jgi:tRNA A37 methylthiotransferase MiaB
MKARELIEQLKKFDENAIVIVSGCYGSTSDNLDNILEVETEWKNALGYTDEIKVVCIPSNICSG